MGHVDVGLGGGEAAAGVVVDHGEGGGVLADGDLQDLGDANGAHVDGAAIEGLAVDQVAVVVDAEDVELLAGVAGDVGAELGDVVRPGEFHGRTLRRVVW